MAKADSELTSDYSRAIASGRSAVGLTLCSFRAELMAYSFLYNFSTSVVPQPLDWDGMTCITGYWFIKTLETEWSPPPALIEFIKKAKADGRPLVYCGFGSITIPDPAALTLAVVAAVQGADVRMVRLFTSRWLNSPICSQILSKGWSARGANGRTDSVLLPETVYQVDSIPHDWLFPQIDVALHHGGAGTTAASLRYGLTTCIHPFFG